MRALITGGAGFIGANLASDLLARKTDVTVLDDLSTGFEENLRGLDIRFVRGSILDQEDLAAALRDVDAIVHLAARPSVPRSIADPVASHDVNATGTLRVLEAARRAGNLHTVVASSSSVYGASTEPRKHEGLRPTPLSPYAVGKLTAETYALAYQHCYDLPTLVFRFFNVFGPLQPAGHAYAAAVPAFIDAALRGEPLQVFGDGGQTRDFTYVASVTEAIAEALDQRATQRDPVNLAFGVPRSLNEVIDLLADRLGTDLRVERQDERAGDIRHSQADGTRLRELFPMLSRLDFATGLDATISWYRTSVRVAS